MTTCRVCLIPTEEHTIGQLRDCVETCKQSLEGSIEQMDKLIQAGKIKQGRYLCVNEILGADQV